MFSTINNEKHYIEFFSETIASFGGDGARGKKKYVSRDNATNNPDKGAYFGCIAEGEEDHGQYSGLSIVIFPSNEENSSQDRWLISLAVGSSGYENDYDLVSLPGTNRCFRKYLNEASFVKSDFQDIESSDGFNSFCSNNETNIPETLTKSYDSYKQFILACSLFNPNEEEPSKQLIKKYLAIYARLRQWPSNIAQRRLVASVLASPATVIDEEILVRDLLEKRKYIVLQGAPGTGKTRLAKKIPGANDIVHFTQFHAETSYNDFVYGIVPDVDCCNLKYKLHEGIFVEAIRDAQKTENQNKKIFLIIDEINRANLSNVLGPSFYLFEPIMSGRAVSIEICPSYNNLPALKLSKLPDNLYVIATMNTADRSLAVVDFALRRRFAWYTLLPHRIEAEPGAKFWKEYFDDIAEIFEKYAKDEELNLQPGHAYFITSTENENEIKNRLRYEVMPLIKEYLMDGMLSRAKDNFISYFRKKICTEMFN